MGGRETIQEIEQTKQEVARELQEKDQEELTLEEQVRMGRGGEALAESDLHLFEKTLLNTNESSHPELKSYVPTGYLDENELNALRRLQSVLLEGKHIIDILKDSLPDGIDKSKLGIKDIEKTMLRKIFFMCQSSKSKNGFAVLELNSQHMYTHENLYSKREAGEKEGIMDKLTGAVSKGSKRLPKNQQFLPEQRRSNEYF